MPVGYLHFTSVCLITFSFNFDTELPIFCFDIALWLMPVKPQPLSRSWYSHVTCIAKEVDLSQVSALQLNLNFT